jgi:hypothetical protein
MSEKNTVQDLINNLKLINDKSDKKIVLPQSKLSVGLKSLQAKHVSKINSSLLASMSQSVKKTVFNKLVEQIFTDILTLPDGVDYNSFTVIDYYYILFTIRESINPIFKIQGDDDNDVSVNITEKLNVYRKTKFKLTLPKVGKKPCEVYLKVPTYKLMRRFEDITHERQVAEEKKGEKNFDMESIMKDMFSFSIIPYIEKIKTVKGKDSIIIQNVPSENTTTANQYETKIQSNEASADLQITTTGELLNVSGIITFPKVEKTTTITKIKDKSGLYIYGQLPINNIASPEVGVLIQVRNKMFISTGVQYNNLSRQLDYKVGVGVKIW